MNTQICVLKMSGCVQDVVCRATDDLGREKKGITFCYPFYFCLFTPPSSVMESSLLRLAIMHPPVFSNHLILSRASGHHTLGCSRNEREKKKNVICMSFSPPFPRRALPLSEQQKKPGLLTGGCGAARR